jgi:hypothetical protein
MSKPELDINTINFDHSQVNDMPFDTSSLLSKIKTWSNKVFSWLNESDTEVKKIHSILNTYNTNKKINFFVSEENIYKYIKNINSNIDSIDIWINNTLKTYDKIIADISNIKKILVSIKQIETSYIYEYTKIIESSIKFFNILLPIIKEITNIRAYINEVFEILISNRKRHLETSETVENKKRKLDEEHIDNLDDKSEITNYLDDQKYSKINVICTFDDIINYLQTNNLCQKLTEKMQTRIERFIHFLKEQNDKDIICIKKSNDSNIKNTCLGFHIIIIMNKNKWVKAIEYNIEQKLFSATGIYEMLSMFGFSSQLSKKKVDSSYQHLDKRVQILYSKNIWIYNDATFSANIHRSWNSNVAGVDTIRINKIQNKLDNGIDLILKASEL